MKAFRRRAKSSAADDKKRNGTGGLPGNPQIIPSLDVAFSLPSENEFRTSLLMPKMADRFSLLRVEDGGASKRSGRSPVQETFAMGHEHGNGMQNGNVNGNMNGMNKGMHMHGRDLSVLEEFDEDEDELPVRPWARQQGNNSRNGHRPPIRDGMSKDEFLRARNQEGNNLFGGRQRTFRVKTDDGHGTLPSENLANDADIDGQYSSSSLSSKSLHSPGFDYRPASSHTSSTSSILFSSAKTSQTPPVVSKPNPLGFDFGLDTHDPSPVPPSPTSTVYEVIDSPTVPDFLIADDGTPTVDLVRNHLRRPDTSHNGSVYLDTPPPQKTRFSKESWRNQLDVEDRDSVNWDGDSGVLSYYGQDDEKDTKEQWKPRARSPTQRKESLPKTTRQSLFDDLPPASTPLNIKTNVTIVKGPTSSPVSTRRSRANSYTSSHSRTSNHMSRSMELPTAPPTAFSAIYETVEPLNVNIREKPDDIPFPLPADNETEDIPFPLPPNNSVPTKSPRQSRRRSYSITPVQRTSSNTGKHSITSASPELRRIPSQPSITSDRDRRTSETMRSPISPPQTTDPRYITPELPSTAIFPHTQPPTISPVQNSIYVLPKPEPVLTPPPSSTTTERKAPAESVIRALKDRNISDPTFISMTATVPTIPIIKMDEEKVIQLRQARKDTRKGTVTSPKRGDPDEMERIASPVQGYTRRKTSQPAIATRTPSGRRPETTAGSVLFDDELRDQSGGSQFRAGPEYTPNIALPSPHLMDDNPYQRGMKPRHRRKVSRSDVDPAVTLSSPPALKTWDINPPRRRVDAAVDPLW